MRGKENMKRPQREGEGEKPAEGRTGEEEANQKPHRRHFKGEEERDHAAGGWVDSPDGCKSRKGR